MDCNRLARSLDSYMDHDLPDADRVALEEHIPGCACCQNLLLREQRLRQRLQLSPVPQRRGFYAMALARATQPRLPSRFSTWKAATAAALAASVATWFLTGNLLQLQQPEAVSPVAGVTMAMYESRTINLVFDSATDIANARLALTLPSGIELASHGHRRSINWKTQLRAGRNVLPLDLVVRGGSGGNLVARLSSEGKEKTFRMQFTIAKRSNHV